MGLRSRLAQFVIFVQIDRREHQALRSTRRDLRRFLPQLYQ